MIEISYLNQTTDELIRTPDQSNPITLSELSIPNLSPMMARILGSVSPISKAALPNSLSVVGIP
jgi:hypothetical protein